ncbi:hypothetical protein MVI01_15380 [Myxococcus virescens]|uniref:Uncharacterized protein n=1 Tax=Myxococcus virescens TaxID=83456 RepID=A0A511H8L4_9BACT|nr:hypothetical protein MVI01_15380 [Myxococcus virescens]
MGNDELPVPGEVEVELQHVRAIALHGLPEGRQCVLRRHGRASTVGDVQRGPQAAEEGEGRGCHAASVATGGVGLASG